MTTADIERKEALEDREEVRYVIEAKKKLEHAKDELNQINAKIDKGNSDKDLEEARKKFHSHFGYALKFVEGETAAAGYINKAILYAEDVTKLASKAAEEARGDRNEGVETAQSAIVGVFSTYQKALERRIIFLERTIIVLIRENMNKCSGSFSTDDVIVRSRAAKSIIVQIKSMISFLEADIKTGRVIYERIQESKKAENSNQSKTSESPGIFTWFKKLIGR